MVSRTAVLVLDPDPAAGAATVEFLERECPDVDASLVAETAAARRRAIEVDPDCLVVAASLPSAELGPFLDVLRHECPSLPVVLLGECSVREVSDDPLAGRLWAADDGSRGVTPLPDVVGYAVAHRRAQAAVGGGADLLRAALDTVERPFFVLDTEGRLAYWNDAVREVTGRDDEDLAGRPATDLFAPGSVEDVADSIERTLANGRSAVEADAVTADGSVVPFEFGCARLEGPDGDPIGVCGTATDVRGRREREQQLAVVHRVLRHNVRNSVNVILGRADHVERGEAPADHVEPIRHQARKLLAVAERTRALSELVATEGGDRRPVDVVELVREELAELRCDADVTARLPETATALADDLMNVAVRELLAHAVERGRYRDDGPRTVDVHVARREGQVHLAVTDDGPSMHPDQRAAFVDGTETPLTHGDGLGLWVVQWVVARSGGTVDVEETEGGVRVSVALPAV
jgi:PAS domain S-box-containing protein